MPSKEIPEPWRPFLLKVDENLQEDVSLHCHGGFVVTMLYGLGHRRMGFRSRSTLIAKMSMS